MMNLRLLHGPAVNNSRLKLISLKQKFDANNVIIYENGTPIGDLLGSLMTPSLLPEEKLFILENPDESLNQLPVTTRSSSGSSNVSLAIWFDHEVSEKKPIMEWVKRLKGEILFFSEGKEVSVFPFLDLLASKDNRAFLEIKKLKSGGFDIFYLITMTFYLLRNLVVTPKTAPSFVKQKLERQRKNFDLKKITKLYKEVLEMDFKLKSGFLEKEQAEFILVNKFSAPD